MHAPADGGTARTQADFTPPPRLGVGLTYLVNSPALMEAGRGLVDFFELSPDVLCQEQGRGPARRLVPQPQLLERTLRDTAALPLVVHGLGLSIGSAHGWDTGYLDLLDEIHARRPFLWHSEHLGFMTAEGGPQGVLHAGTVLPMPFTEEALQLLVPRAAAMAQRYRMPFLLENLTYYLPELPAEHGWDEIRFLNELAERSGCGLLFDLYNFHCNALNLGFDALEALSRLRLDRVVQVHVAGGTTHDGFLMDVHSQIVPEPVWELLEWLVPRAPALAGVSYELLEEAQVSPGEVARQLERARAIWSKHHRTGKEAAGRGAA